MPDFEYTALTETGKRKRGMVSAETASDARRKLRQDGLNILDMQSKHEKKQAEVSEKMGRIKKKDVAMAFRQLSTLLRGGMALVPSLEALAQQFADTPLGKVLEELKEDVRTGSSFGDALEQYPGVFPEIYVSIVNAGESVGALDDVLRRLAEMIERSLEVIGKVKSAMAYPAILLITGIAVIVFLLTFVVPGITQLFVDLEQQLPLPTVVLIRASNFLRQFFWVLAISVVMVTIAFRVISRREFVKLKIDSFKLKIPVVGPLMLKSAMARFTRTLSVMLKSGVPVLQALENAGRVTANSALKSKIEVANKQVEEGAGLAEPLEQSSIFPPIVVHMIAAGEASGNVDEGLLNVSEIYQSELENSIRTLTSLVEPIMILVMGTIIGFMVLAVLLPIFEINQMVG